jgi:hypothetical protein
MSINQPSFKVYVGTFTDKSVNVSGNTVTIYQINSYTHALAKILDEVEVINEYYDTTQIASALCTESLFGCNERSIVRVNNNNCTTTTGTGAQGPQGAPGQNGANGLSSVITLNVVPVSCGTPPSGSISSPLPTGTGQQSQQLTLNLPEACPTGPGGGGPDVKVTGSNGSFSTTATNSTAINFNSGINLDLGSTKPTSSSHQITIQANCTAIGYIKIFAVSYDDATKSFVYQGHPSEFMTNENLTATSNNPVFTDADIQVLNIAEIGSTVSVPLGVPLAPPDGSGRVSGFSYPKGAPLPTSIIINPEIVIPLFQTVNAAGQKIKFINQRNTLNGNVKKAKIKDVKIFNNNASGPKWRYKLELGEISFSTTNSNLPPEFVAAPWLGVSELWAYNRMEVGNTTTVAYGYPISAFKSKTSTSPEGFSLSNSPEFLFSHVPLNTIIDIEIDSSGSFYIKEPNAIVGVC